MTAYLSSQRSILERILFCLALLFTMSSSHSAECERPGHLHFSLVPRNDVQKELLALQPLFKDLQIALGIPVEVVMPSSYGAVVEGLLAGAIDLARLGPASYVTAKKSDPQVTAFATVARNTAFAEDGTAFYHSVLITRSDSGYNNIESLRDKKLVLVDPDSTSGGLIPRRVFSDAMHLSLERYFGQIVYSGAHDQSISAVAKKQADAAFLSSTALTLLIENGVYKKDDFRTLWRSAPIPRDPYVLRGQLCSAFKNKIKRVFLRHGRDANKALLDNLKATRFVPVTDRNYQIVRDLW